MLLLVFECVIKVLIRLQPTSVKFFSCKALLGKNKIIGKRVLFSNLKSDMVQYRVPANRYQRMDCRRRYCCAAVKASPSSHRFIYYSNLPTLNLSHAQPQKRQKKKKRRRSPSCGKFPNFGFNKNKLSVSTSLTRLLVLREQCDQMFQTIF